MIRFLFRDFSDHYLIKREPDDLSYKKGSENDHN